MAKPAAIGSRKVKMKLTAIVTIIVVILLVVAFVYTSHQQSSAEEAKMPKSSLNKLVKDLRTYHKDLGKFPETFEQVQAQVWKLPQPPLFGDKGQSFNMRNYYYLLNYITPHAVTVWAAPINEKFREGNAFFVVVYQDREEVWKGPALEPKEFATLPANPTEFQLTTMGLTKQESRENKSTAKKSAGSLF